MKSYYLVGEDGEDKILLINDFVLGRTSIKNCYDKKISRKHGVIQVQNDKFTITALHTNPIFYKKKPNEEVELIQKDEQIILLEDEQFGLLPDSFWFRITHSDRIDKTINLISIKEEIVLPPESDINHNNLSTSNAEISTEPQKVLISNSETVLQFRVRNIDEINSDNQLLNNSTVDENNYNGGETSKRRMPDWLLDQEHSKTSPKKRNINQSNDINTATSSRISPLPPANTQKNSTEVMQQQISLSTDMELNEPAINTNESIQQQVENKDVIPNENAIKLEIIENNLNTSLSSPSCVIPQSSCSTVDIQLSSICTDIDIDKPGTSANVQVKKEIKLKLEIADTKSSEEDSEDVAVTSPSTIVTINQPSCTNPTSNVRDSCQYGIRCYRKNPGHRTEFAHPGDSDYKRPNFPPASPGAPDCPYGNSCYRRNPIHFQQFRHPTSVLDRLRKRNIKKNYATNNSESPDFSCDSSDEFDPNNFNDDDSTDISS